MVPGGESGQPLAVVGKRPATAGRQGHEIYGREEKILFLPNAEYMRFDGGFSAANHVYEKAVPLCCFLRFHSSAAIRRPFESGAGAGPCAPNSVSKKTGVSLKTRPPARNTTKNIPALPCPRSG